MGLGLGPKIGICESSFAFAYCTEGGAPRRPALFREEKMSRRLSIVVKIAISFAIVIVLLISVAAIGIGGMTTMSNGEKTLASDSLSGTTLLALARGELVDYTRLLFEHIGEDRLGRCKIRPGDVKCRELELNLGLLFC